MESSSGTMSAASPRPRLVPPRQLGSFRVGAEVAAARRATLLLAHRDGHSGPWLVREPHPRSDPAAIREEHARAAIFEALEPGSETIDGVEILFRRPVLGESLDTILDAHLRSGEPMHPGFALYVAAGIALKLHASEAHADLVPHHVLIGFDGSVHLVDAVGTDWPERSAQASRLGYRSPEHVRRIGLSSASDVFVLGVLFFEMTTAKRLFAGDSRPSIDGAILEARAPRPRTLVPSYPVELQGLLRSMLRPEPEARFAGGPAAFAALSEMAHRMNAPSAAQVGAFVRGRFQTASNEWKIALEAIESFGPARPPVSIPPALPVRSPPPLRPSQGPEKRVAAPFSRPSPPPLRASQAPAPVAAKPAPVLTLEDLDRADAHGGMSFTYGEDASPGDGLDLENVFDAPDRSRAPTQLEHVAPKAAFDDEHTVEELAPIPAPPVTDLVADLLGGSSGSGEHEADAGSDDSPTEERLMFGAFDAAFVEASSTDNLSLGDLGKGPDEASGSTSQEAPTDAPQMAPRKIRARTSSVMKPFERGDTPNEAPPIPAARPRPVSRDDTPTSEAAPDPERAFLEAMRILENKRRERERSDTPADRSAVDSVPRPPKSTPPAPKSASKSTPPAAKPALSAKPSTPPSRAPEAASPAAKSTPPPAKTASPLATGRPKSLPPAAPKGSEGAGAAPAPTGEPASERRVPGRRSDTLVVRARNRPEDAPTDPRRRAVEDEASSAKTVEITPDEDGAVLVVPVAEAEVPRRSKSKVAALLAVVLVALAALALVLLGIQRDPVPISPRAPDLAPLPTRTTTTATQAATDDVPDEPSMVTIELRVRPAASRIYVDGVLLPEGTPLELAVPTRVEIKLEGYETYEAVVDPAGGPIDVSLAKSPKKKRRPR
ncbi:MAG: hypothetical protein HYV07_17665 [Deltaproteobacteria bacterium]|nr:hypothetical protein [Deltaproteobacteria bacterium]